MTKKNYKKLNIKKKSKKHKQAKKNNYHKTKKNLKFIGGGKSKENIIDELMYSKKKNNYLRWIDFGSLFGYLVLDTPDDEYPQGIYKDINNRNVVVSQVSTEYNPKYENVAVFDYIGSILGPHVEQASFRIVPITETLSTDGIAMCSGLSMTIGNKKFLAHLDAETNIEPIVDEIIKTLSEQDIDTTISNVNIYAGKMGSDFTVKKAKEICSKIGIDDKNINILKVCFMDKVKI